MKTAFLFFAFFLSFQGIGQELPPFVNFSPNLYGAGNQNWMVSEAENNNIYIANGTGLLEFTGEEWNLYPMPNKTIVRSVLAVGEKIFSGAFMEFGYWERTDLGTLEYTSFLPQLSQPLNDGEQFWHIKAVPGFVVFQSFESLYLFDLATEKVQKTKTVPGDFISNLFEVDNHIFYQVAEKGLFSLQQGESMKVIPPEILGEITIVHLFQKNKELHFISESGRFYSWNGSQLQEYNEEVSNEISGASIFSALEIPDGSVVLGTVAQGLYHISGKTILHHFNQRNGFLNNTVLSLFLDSSHNLWAGLDHGLSVMELNSDMKLYEDRNGDIGSVYCSLKIGEYLYIGTNQGLYVRKEGTVGFEKLKGTNGQVWSLQQIDDILFCGHNNGTYVVEGTTAKRISDRSGTWGIKKLKDKDNSYIQGHYNGISFLRKEGNSFKELPLLPNFPHSSRYLVSEENNIVWVGNEHKGVFRLKLDSSLTGIEEIRNYTFQKNSGITSSIFKFNDTLYYSSRQEILQYRPERDTFVSGSALAETVGNLSRISGRIISLQEKEIWGFQENSIFKVGRARLRSGYSKNQVYLSNESRAIPLGNENISQLEERKYFLGVANGYVVFEETIKDPPAYSIRIDRIEKSVLDGAAQLVALAGEDAFHYRTNNLTFSYSIPEHPILLDPVYSYRLLGQTENWSEWSKLSSVGFENLPFGTYEFQIRGLVGNQETGVKSFYFEIERPWYLKWPAIVVYCFLFGALLLGINRINQKRHEKLNREKESALRMKHLEAEQEIIKLQNEQLEQNMELKNKELAFSTMSLIRKNEFLSMIKEQLREASNPARIKSVITTIDKDISEEDNWNFFKEAFNNADKDFFKKIKSRHPDLTSNDLKLCAYLRLNLSSKEIAPLLNISVKSVEIKRYRLRKKMNLTRKEQLTDYILEI